MSRIARSIGESGVRGEVQLPTFVIIGAMRSGTTSLARYLDAHPQAAMARPKEVHYFDDHFGESLDWYAKHFSAVSGELAIGEATQRYMYDDSAIQRMASVLPDCRLIAILRNPVDRAYSHYWHNRARKREHLSFSKAVSVEADRLSTHDRRLRARFAYLDRGRYLKQLLRVCEFYPREALLVVLFEEMIADPDGTYRGICRFLRIDEDFLPANLGAPINRYIRFRSPLLRNATRRFPRVLRDAIGRLNSRPADYPPMDKDLRAELLEGFREENAALAAWLGRDLEAWRE